MNEMKAISDPGKPLRVLFAITDLGKGGAERFLLDLCRAFERLGGVEFQIAALYDNNGYRELSAGIPIVQLDYQTFSLRRPAPNVRWARLLDEFAPHVVHSHRFLGEFITAQSVRPQIAYVCHGHDNMVQLAKPTFATLLDRKKLVNWLERRHLIRHKYRIARTSFVANSEHTLEYYKSVLPAWMREDVRLLHYGFDYRRFLAPSPRTVRPGQPIRLVNVGSFVDKKNQQLAIRTVGELRGRGMDVGLELLGDGPNRGLLQALTYDLGLSDRIHFRGNVERVEDYLRKADIYLHTATYEPFGLVLLEAMAAGLPCVIRDGQGDRELIVEGKNGFLLPGDDPVLYADRIQRLMTDPETYAPMSVFAQGFAGGFDINRAAQRFVDLYIERCARARTAVQS